MIPTLQKNKRVIILASLTGIIVIGSIIYITTQPTSSTAMTAPSGSITQAKIVPGPKKIQMPETNSLKTATTADLQTFINQKINSDKGLTKPNRLKLKQQLTDYTAFEKQQQSQNTYLNNIDKMSMQLHKLDLQSQINQQQLTIAKSEADLAQTKALKATANTKLMIAQNKGRPITPKLSFNATDFAQLTMIYRQNHHYFANLIISGHSMLVHKGSIVETGSISARVSNINANSVELMSNKDHQHIELSLASKMENI